ncbi:MAG: hypothetical protein ACREUW_19470 [Burkholderiales bacterium]
MDVNPYATPKAEVAGQPVADAAPALWNPGAAGSWSLLFTPIFGSYLLKRNWESIGDDDKARGSRNWMLLSILMLFPSVITGIGLIYLIVWYFAANRPQMQYVKERWGTDYPRQPWGKPLSIAAVLWIIPTGLILFFVLSALPR